MITYPGLPAPVVSDFLSRESAGAHYAEGTSFQIGRIEMVANTGTYIDAPFHRFDGGDDLSMLPLERLADVPGLLIDATGRSDRAIDADVLEGLPLAGHAILIRTDWDRHWRTPQYADDAPFLTRRAAEMLAQGDVALVGIDSVNIDDRLDGSRPAHTVLLAAGIPVVEHLCNLKDLPSDGFQLHCVPVKFRGVGTFPVRAYAVIEGDYADTTLPA